MALSIHDFAELMIAELARNSRTVNFNDLQEKRADLPFNYRERIENILCANNGWKERFACLIDIDEYFDDHFWWEEKLAQEINNVARELHRNIAFDIVHELISIILTNKEIECITEKYDESTLHLMNHFASVMTSHIYSRRHKEEFFDYSARSAALMKENHKKRLEMFNRF